jgi:predicted metalloendopeptidase
MSDETKKQAQTKLSTFKRKIGYPDVLRGYKGLTIDNRSHAGNLLRSTQFQIRRNFEDLGKPRDKARMGMTPPTVNASYNPVDNDITFPAGILQPLEWIAIGPAFAFREQERSHAGGRHAAGDNVRGRDHARRPGGL